MYCVFCGGILKGIPSVEIFSFGYATRVIPTVFAPAGLFPGAFYVCRIRQHALGTARAWQRDEDNLSDGIRHFVDCLNCLNSC